MTENIFKTFLTRSRRFREEDRDLEIKLKSLIKNASGERPPEAYWDAFWPRLRSKILSSDRSAARFYFLPLHRVRRVVLAAAGILLILTAGAVFYLHFLETAGEPPVANRLADRAPAAAAPDSEEFDYVIARAKEKLDLAERDRRLWSDTSAGFDRRAETEHFIFPARREATYDQPRHVLISATAESSMPFVW